MTFEPASRSGSRLRIRGAGALLLILIALLGLQTFVALQGHGVAESYGERVRGYAAAADRSVDDAILLLGDLQYRPELADFLSTFPGSPAATIGLETLLRESEDAVAPVHRVLLISQALDVVVTRDGYTSRRTASLRDPELFGKLQGYRYDDRLLLSQLPSGYSGDTQSIVLVLPNTQLDRFGPSALVAYLSVRDVLTPDTVSPSAERYVGASDLSWISGTGTPGWGEELTARLADAAAGIQSGGAEWKVRIVASSDARTMVALTASPYSDLVYLVSLDAFETAVLRGQTRLLVLVSFVIASLFAVLVADLIRYGLCLPLVSPRPDATVERDSAAGAVTPHAVTTPRSLRPDARPLGTGVRRPDLAESVDTILEARYADPTLRVEEIAHEIGLSPRYLSARYRAETGRTIVSTLTAIRMLRAEELLTTTDIAITQIASLVGYQQSQYFSRVFARERGIPPLRFRSTRRGTLRTGNNSDTHDE